ncbi:UvrD-helicase domain-containing protein [Cyclobacteriaceae bacterium]|nr:UvrD-helicase domain-containing protein [Cyclobacteriaceae bacterium]
MSTARPFQIYKSSAGSGKTHQLTLEYLKLALREKSAFKQILGVTFTNKATSEMKSRIVKVLETLSLGKDHAMKTDLMAALQLSTSDLKKRAEEVLSNILHQYGRFSIVTIDSFFYQVIRSFAQEMSLQGSFNVDLNQAQVIKNVVDQLLLDIGNPEQKELKKWLIEFAESKVEEGNRWDFRADIEKLGGQILTDNFKRHAEVILKLSDDPKYFPQVKKALYNSSNAYRVKCHKLADLGIKHLDEIGGLSYIKGKRGGPAGLFYKIVNQEFEVSAPRKAAMGNLEAWLTKEHQKSGDLISFLEGKLWPVYDELVEYMVSNELLYFSTLEARRYLYTFGILSKINKELVKFREENDMVLIADLPDFLNKIINDSDTPYIYEKVGERYAHYLIDEFQDTSEFQWENFKPLVKNGTDQGYFSMVVGDIKQSIYRWRGGNWRLLKDHVKEDIGVEASQDYQLDANWRSGKNIVEFNNKLFSTMPVVARRYFSDLLPTHEAFIENALNAYDGVAQKVILTDDESYINFTYLEADDENTWSKVALKKTIEVVEKLQHKGYQLRDIAILVRTKKEGKVIADGFLEYSSSEASIKGLNYDVVSSEALYLSSSEVVNLIISLMRWVHQNQDKIALWEWFTSYWAIKNEKPKQEAFERVDQWQTYMPAEFLSQLSHFKTLSLYELIESFIELLALNDLPEQYTYLQGLQDAVLDFTKNTRGDLPSFLIWWEEEGQSRAIKITDENDAIKVLTIHKAKGLEYPVVILPFLNWPFEKKGKEEIIWVDGGPLNDIVQMPIIPIKHSKNLLKTYWSDVYAAEHINGFIDNMNVLYVALTRPTHALYVFAEQKVKHDLKDMGSFVKNILMTLSDGDENPQTFTFGALPDGIKKAKTQIEFSLTQYPSSSWREKALLQTRGGSMIKDVSLDAQQRGIDIHDALSQLHQVGDELRIDNLELRGLLELIIYHKDVVGFFEQTDEVILEHPMLLPGGEVRRIDRLVKKGGYWHVIDFKTGHPRAKDQNQVKEYIQILSRMGFEGLKGYLIYLDPISLLRI